jgi:hypothetical protein
VFRIYYSLFKYLVIPFGLTNTLVTFQRIINKQLHEYLNIFIVTYLDNILIFSKIEIKYIEYIRKVLSKL